MAKKTATKPEPTPLAKEPGYFLGSVTFKKDYRCFKQGDVIPFKPGVNVIVGDQGSGKSTVFQCVREYKKFENTVGILTIVPAKMMSFDLEMDLPRGKSSFSDRMPMGAQVAMMWASHGESVKAVLNGIDNPTFTDTFFLFDEPDIGLSPRSAYQLVKQILACVKNGNQIVVSIHNPIVIQEIGDVFSMEHRKFMTSEEYLESQRVPRPEAEPEPESKKKSTKVEPPYKGPGRNRPRKSARNDAASEGEK